MSAPRPVTWTIRYRKADSSYAHGRTSSLEIATACESKGWSVVAGNQYGDATVRNDILAARKEADAEFDGGWEGDCTKGRECDWTCCMHVNSAVLT
jgi:hypothetical protein